MTARKRKKNTRQRGGTTHGWGARKKHRGSGNRGGVGMAGTGKRAQSKKPSIWGTDYFGMHGFKKKGVVRQCICINLSDLANYVEKLVDKNDINLSEMGFNKLLGSGVLSKAYNITVEYASANAIEKVKACGGKVNLTGSKGKKGG